MIIYGICHAYPSVLDVEIHCAAVVSPDGSITFISIRPVARTPQHCPNNPTPISNLSLESQCFPSVKQISRFAITIATDITTNGSAYVTKIALDVVAIAAVIIYSRAVPVIRLMDFLSILSLKDVLLIINPITILDTSTAPTSGKLLITGWISIHNLRMITPTTITIPTIAVWNANGSRDDAFVTPFPIDERSAGLI